MPRRLVAVSLVLLLSACLADPAGPHGRIVVESLNVAADSVVDGSPGRPLFPLRFRAVDQNGRPIPAAQVKWAVAGTYAYVTESSTATDADGSFGATWILGTSAADRQSLSATVRTRSGRGELVLLGRAIPSEVVWLAVTVDTLTARVGDSIPIPVLATDPFGNEFVPDTIRLDVLDGAIAAPLSGDRLAALTRGHTRVLASAQGVTDTVVLHIMQRVEAILPDQDSLTFTALGDSTVLTVRMVDDKGLPVADSAPAAIVQDTVVVGAEGAATLVVRSRAEGVTAVRLEAGAVRVNIPVVVNQIPERIVAALTDTNAIVDLPLGAVIPVACEAQDRNGYSLAQPPTVDPSAGGRWVGTRCDSLRIARSGFDTLQLVAGTVRASLPAVLAVRPLVGIPQALMVDSLPAGLTEWAPSARRNRLGQIEVYFAGGSPDSLGVYRSNLHRLVSSDGLRFAYDGIALRHEDDPCDPQGSGIENVSVVPRSDGPGSRMFYAAGSNSCYGWQVFSAISSDERTWSKEPGVRLSNGGTLPPDAPITPLWPAGEGMVTDQLPDGSWRMVVSTYEQLTPAEDKFQILEWRSADQLTWIPLRTLVSTRDLPPEGQRSAYSPTIRQFVLGIWRMIFTADDLNVGGRSRLWSAVSTDLVSWQQEGEMLSTPGVHFMYSALVDEHLYTLQAVGDLYNTAPQLATTTVTMP